MADISGAKGRRVQLRAQRSDGWTKAKRAKFLEVLAATCNTVAAARAVDKPEVTARRLRKRDGEFSQLWDEALAIGYERLEQQLLARALGEASSGDNPTLDEIVAAPPPPAHDFDPELAIRVLQLRRKIAGRDGQAGRPGRRPQAEIDALLLTRLDALAAQRAGGRR